MAMLLFGLHLVYKLRNASGELHKEKLILSVAVFVELLISAMAYAVRHALWHQLHADHLLALYALRCQLTVSLTVGLVFGPKVSGLVGNQSNSTVTVTAIAAEASPTQLVSTLLTER